MRRNLLTKKSAHMKNAFMFHRQNLCKVIFKWFLNNFLIITMALLNNLVIHALFQNRRQNLRHRL
jgi:hypothetical protein